MERLEQVRRYVDDHAEAMISDLQRVVRQPSVSATGEGVAECARLLRPDGYCVVVNDNVRYSGEEVPVDLICSDLAESFGLKVQAIWVLPRGKGNSSQQMGKHGRIELRKAVYIWSKPQ